MLAIVADEFDFAILYVGVLLLGTDMPEQCANGAAPEVISANHFPLFHLVGVYPRIRKGYVFRLANGATKTVVYLLVTKGAYGFAIRNALAAIAAFD